MKNNVVSFFIRNIIVSCVCFFIIAFSLYSIEEDIFYELRNDPYIYISVLFAYIIQSELSIFIDKRYHHNFYIKLNNKLIVSVNKYYVIIVSFIVVISIYLIVFFEYFVEFRVASLIAVLSSIYVFMFDLILITRNYYKRLRNERLRNAELGKAKLESDLKVLQNQINPHFLFNSLNVLVSEIYFDQDKAVKYTQHLSDIYRYVLQNTKKNLVDLRTELECLDSYIYLFRTKYDDGFQVIIDIDDDLLKLKIPPLALQMLVENSIKHNIILSDRPLIVKIYSNETNLIVSNNINKKKDVNSESTGLKNINTRYKIISDKSIKIEQSETEFKVTLPLL